MSSTTSGENTQNADETSAFYANNDASSYNARYLKSIRNKERFQELHFYQCDEHLIDELIPKKTGKGTQFPPTSYRASANTLHQWRDMEEEEQLRVIEQENFKTVEESKRREAVATAAGGDVGATTNELKRTLDTAAVVTAAAAPTTATATETNGNQGDGAKAETAAPPAPKVAKIEEVQVRAAVLDIPTRWHPTAKDINVDFRKGRICDGITLESLKKAFPHEVEKLKGFGVLVAEAMKHKVEVYSKGLCWPFACDPRLAGCLVNQEASGEVVLSWICVQMEEKDGVPITNEFKFEGIHFYHPTCDRSSTSLLCVNCHSHVNEFVLLCGAFTQN